VGGLMGPVLQVGPCSTNQIRARAEFGPKISARLQLWVPPMVVPTCGGVCCVSSACRDRNDYHPSTSQVNNTTTALTILI